MRPIGRERDAVSGEEVVLLAVDVDAEGAREDDEALVGPGRVRLGGMRRARRQTELVDLAER